MKIQSLSAAGFLVPLLAFGCEKPVPVANDAPIAQLDFTNGPSDLPNVFRGIATCP